MKALLYILLPLVALSSYGQGFIGRTSAANVDFRTASVSSSLPEITWTSPVMESSFSTQSALILEISVKSLVDLKTVTLGITNNGNLSEKTFAVKPGESSTTIVQTVALLDGENIIELIAENITGGKVSSWRSVIVGKENAHMLSANRKDRALIFATDKYDHWDDLVNPVHGAREIEQILKEKYNFETEVIENATLEEVLGKLTDYNQSKFNVQDQLFVFFAGHGSFDETLGEGYIVASNSLQNDKGRTTYLPHTVLRQRLDNIKCEHIFLAMDVCFGGTIDPVLANTRSVDAYTEPTDEEYLVRKLSRRTRKFLTSGSKEYVSDGVVGKHSPFAAKFIQSLREVGDGKDRIVTLAELQVYFTKLPTEPRFGGFGSDDKASDFVFVAR